MKKLLIALATVICLGFAAKSQNPSKAEVISQLKGVASFKTDGVNLRQSPSTSSPYLIYMGDDEEEGSDPDAVRWSSELGRMRIGNQYITPDHVKLQGNEWLRLGYLGSQGDWVKLFYNPCEVWTMKKFVSIDPLVPITPSMTYENSLQINGFYLTGTEKGATAILYEGPGIDTEGGIYVGSFLGNCVLFDYYVPCSVWYEPTEARLSFSNSIIEGYKKLSFGKVLVQKDEYGNEHFNVKALNSADIQKLRGVVEKLPENNQKILVATASGLVFL